MILGFDVSHYQAGLNMAAAKAGGNSFVVIKATESTTFVDPSLATFRAQAHAAGLVVGFYHFARAGNAAAEAAFFVKAVGKLQPGEFLVLDQEVPNTVAWCKTWLDTVYAATGVRPFIYMNQGNGTGVTSGDWTQVAKNYGLWLAKYDQAPASQTSVAYWGPVAMKQYYDKGNVAGVTPCDVDAFYGTTDQLRAYGYQGATDMTTVDLTPAAVQAIADAVWLRQIKNPTRVASAEVMLANADSYANTSVFAIRDAVAATVGRPMVDVQGLAAAIVAALPAAQAVDVAQAVVDQLGQRISTAPA